MTPSPRTAAPIAAAVLGAVFGVVLIAALQGHVPGADPPAREPSSDSPASLAVMGVLVTLAAGVVLLAVVARWRQRRGRSAAGGSRPDWLRGAGRGRVARRYVVLAVAAGIAWLSLVALLSRVGGRDEVLSTVPDTPSSAADPGSADTAADAPPAPPEDSGNSDVTGYLAVATVGFLLAVTAGALLGRRASPPAVTASPDEPGSRAAPAESLVRAAEVGLAAVGDLSRDPRTAIIACFAAMERQLATVPGAAPQEFDTASEVLSRGVASGALRPDSAVTLVDLFDEARFSSHVMDEGHRDTAAGILEVVLDELRSRS